MSTWVIYWWVKTGGPKKYGKDIVTIDGDELTEFAADNILSYHAEGGHGGDLPDMPNFRAIYPNADFCEDFGVSRIQQAENKRSKEKEQ